MKYPEFIIIGAAKSGTTTLYKNLVRHPDVFMAEPKEPSYFSYEERYQRGDDWYLSLFSRASDGQVCGEASTAYTSWPHYPLTAQRMHKLLPDTKLIYIMRHPVDRAFSHYAQCIKNDRKDDGTDKPIDRTFEEWIEEDNLVVEASKYILQINKYLEFYQKENMLFLLMEDLRDDQYSVLVQVCRFIGVPEDKIEHDIVANTANKYNEWQVRSRITGKIRNLPGGSFISEHLPQGIKDFIYNGLKNLKSAKKIQEQYIPEPMKPKTKFRLIEEFCESNKQLSEFLGRDLSRWNE